MVDLEAVNIIKRWAKNDQSWGRIITPFYYTFFRCLFDLDMLNSKDDEGASDGITFFIFYKYYYQTQILF